MAKLPDIVIAHQGNHQYFKESVAAAAKHGRVHVLTFTEPDGNDQFEIVRANYIHLSGGSVQFELLWCLRRYFLMRDLFLAENIKSGWLLDSDLYLAEPLPTPDQFPAGTFCAMSSPPVVDPLDRHFSPHCSFWTLEALESFCQFLVKTYLTNGDELRALDSQRRANGLTSAVGEMILLGMWGLNNSRVLDLFEFADGGLIDHNLRGLEQPRGQKLLGAAGNKVLHKIDGRILAETTNYRMIPMRCVHFQGAAKKLMPDFINGRQTSYAVKAGMRFKYNKFRLTVRRLKKRRQISVSQ